MSAAAEMIQHYAEVRSRLYGRPERQKQAVYLVREDALPSPVIVEPVKAVERASQPGMLPRATPVSLDMLSRPSWRFLVALAAAKHNQTAQDIIGYSRSRKVALARHEAVYLMAYHTPHSIARIGRFLNRDHSTMLSSLRKFPFIERPGRPSKDKETVRQHVDGLPDDGTLLEIVQVGYEKGISKAEIAKAAGVSPQKVKKTASKANLHHPYRPKSKLDLVIADTKETP